MKTQSIVLNKDIKLQQTKPNKNIINYKTPDIKNDEVSLATTKKEVSTAKKVGVGIASALYPGLGQVCNGEVAKGVNFFLGGMGIDILATVAASALMTVNPAIALITVCAGSLGHIALNIYSAVDAVKNVK